MAIALVQTAAIGSTGSGTSQQTSAFATSPTVGNYLVAWAWGWNSGTHTKTPGFTDTAGNTWVVPTNAYQHQAADCWAVVGYTKVAATGASFRVTSTEPDSGGSSIMVVAASSRGWRARRPSTARRSAPAAPPGYRPPGA
jgi:hypothetical protein